MKNKTIPVVLAVMVLVYFSSYVWIRKGNTRIREVDGCPSEGCTIVNFPMHTFFVIYSPLITADERMTHAKFEFYN